MTPQERNNLAEMMVGNPLYAEIMGELEQQAVESLIYAKTEQERVEAQWRVRSVRAFRADCEASLRNNRPPKGAPA